MKVKNQNPPSPPHLTEKVRTSVEVIQEALKENPSSAFVMFSGGRDSLTVAYLMADVLDSIQLCHINTGIGIRQTREFVRATAKAQNWPLLEIHPTGKTYRDMILRWGFPGPSAHRYSYQWLKERALNKLVSDHKKHYKDRIALITGVRTEESKRRMGNVRPIQRNGAKLWVSPIHHWTGIDIRDYLGWKSAQINPVSDILGYSGECLCGAYAREGERELIRTFFPEADSEISALEEIAKERGHVGGWGCGGSYWLDPNAPKQMQLPEDAEVGMLCAACVLEEER